MGKHSRLKHRYKYKPLDEVLIRASWLSYTTNTKGKVEYPPIPSLILATVGTNPSLPCYYCLQMIKGTASTNIFSEDMIVEKTGEMSIERALLHENLNVRSVALRKATTRTRKPKTKVPSGTLNDSYELL